LYIDGRGEGTYILGVFFSKFLFERISGEQERRDQEQEMDKEVHWAEREIKENA